MVLFDLKNGQVAEIGRLSGLDLVFAKHLIELGFTRGAKVVMLKKSRSVCLVGLRGYALSLDSQAASQIEVIL